MFPDMMKGLLSKCLCQQLKINPDPTHKIYWRRAGGPVWPVEKFTLLHLFTELEIALPTECSARLRKTLLKEDSAPNQQMSLILK